MGMNFFPSRNRCCEARSERKIKVHGREEIEYYHRGKAGHRRWDVENDAFNTLSTHWALDHCFKHEPTAITNFILTLFITFVLLQSFYLRNLKPPRRFHLTLIGLGDELDLSVRLCTHHAPWLDKGG